MPTDSPADRVALLAEEARTSYADLKAAAEAQVVRTEWTNGPRYADTPAYFEIKKIRRGERLRSRPTDPGRARQYGFDAQGRVVVERQPVRIGDEWRVYETFWRHEAEGSARFSFTYDPKKTALTCAWLSLGERGALRVETIAAHGRRVVDVYAYGDDGRLRTVTTTSTVPGGAESVDYRDITHDEAGAVTRVVWRTASGQETVDYERPADADRLAAAQTRLIDGLADAIANALASAAIDEPVTALAFSTSDAHDQHRFPPIVSFATQATLERVRDDLGPDGLASLWNPAEWDDNELTLSLDPPLAALCASVSQDIWQQGLDAQADHALLRLATALEARELPIVRADTFVVVVVEIDGAEDTATQVAGQIGREAREKLRTLGLL